MATTATRSIDNAFAAGVENTNNIEFINNDNELYAYLRGRMSGYCDYMAFPPTCVIRVHKDVNIDKLVTTIGIPCNLSVNTDEVLHNNAESQIVLTFKGSNAIDLMGKMYGASAVLSNMENGKRCSELYKYAVTRGNGRMPNCLVRRVLPDAVVPFKVHESDVGYDLTIIKKHKQVNDVVTLYDTGIQIQLEYGYYAEIVPRSSIIKSGYMLANSIGIIDNSYSGNLYVALAKIDPNAADIECPCRCVQLIIRKQEHAVFNVTDDEFDTQRGAGGFGSTNKT